VRSKTQRDVLENTSEIDASHVPAERRLVRIKKEPCHETWKAEMTHLRSYPQVTPSAIAEMLPTSPVLTAPPGSNGEIIAQLYRHPSAGVTHSGLPAHGLVIGMGGQSLVTDKTAHGHRQAWCLPGCVSLTPAGQPLQRTWAGRPEAMVILMDRTLISSIAEELGCQRTGSELCPQLGVPDPVLHNLARVLLATMADPGCASTLMVDALARAGGAHLLQSYSGASVPRNQSPPSLSSARFRRIVEFMSANIGRSIRLAELAEVCGLSKTHFGRAFKAASGKTPHGYLIWLRVERAKHLLETTSMSMLEIADKCGFGQPQYFATVFQREVGITPTAWRLEKGS
jgi:AraC family transcriptional regulator